MSFLIPFFALVLTVFTPLRSVAAPTLEPEKIMIAYGDSDVKIGPLSYVAKKTTVADVEAALGKPDRVVESNYVLYCYDRLGLRFYHAADSKTKTVNVTLFLEEKQMPREVMYWGKLAPGKVFKGVIRIRDLEFKAPLKAKDVSSKLNPLFPRSEAVPGNDQFGNTLYRLGNCRTVFQVRKETGEVILISLDEPMPK